MCLWQPVQRAPILADPPANRQNTEPHPRSALTRLASPSPSTEGGRAERSEAGGEVRQSANQIPNAPPLFTRRDQQLDNALFAVANLHFEDKISRIAEAQGRSQR